MSDQSSAPFHAIILAAGEGTRMRSRRPKVLHEVAGRSMLGHVLAAAREAGASRISVVVGPDRNDVATEARRSAPDAGVFEQAYRRGTAHAVLAAREAIDGQTDVLVLFGDTPLVRSETIAALAAAVRRGSAVVALGFEAANPKGYGRLIIADDGALTGIREERDASADERTIRFCNGGLMALAGPHALSLLDAIEDKNAQGEYYLPDAVGSARARGLGTSVVTAPEAEVLGVNDRVQLADAEAAIQTRLRETAMRSGVTLQDPASVHLSFDTEIAPDVVIEPHVVFGTAVKVAGGTVIHAFSHLAGAEIGPDCSIGPFARLRPGTIMGAGARIGNFVETKAAAIGTEAKINHLTYIGDAKVGASANVGAGTITCNYDGFGKYRTEIGPGAFIGSNSSLVAPVTIGAGAYVASGSVITDAIEPDALAIARGRQVNKSGWAAQFRSQKSAAKRKV